MALSPRKAFRKKVVHLQPDDSGIAKITYRSAGGFREALVFFVAGEPVTIRARFSSSPGLNIAVLANQLRVARELLALPERPIAVRHRVDSVRCLLDSAREHRQRYNDDGCLP